MEAFPFSVEIKEIAPDIKLFYFDITSIASASLYLDSHVTTIFCGCHSDNTLEHTKRCLADLFASKINNNSWLYGAISEFFVHLLLNHKGYKQDCLYQNLEERSIKKGFDGVYSIGDELWLMESKSGHFDGSLTHYEKITEAANDLRKKVSGRGGSNNPWQNAYNHASHIDVGSKTTIRSQIKELAALYANGTYRNIAMFNIIPCATLFYTGDIEREELGVVAQKVNRYFAKEDHGQIRVICISNRAVDDFLSYLGLRRKHGQ